MGFQPVGKILGIGKQHMRIIRSCDGDRGHRGDPFNNAAGRFVHLVGEGGDGINRRGHIVVKGAHIGPFNDFSTDNGNVVPGHAAQFVQIINPSDRVFDAGADGLLYLGGGRTGIGDAHLDHRGRGYRKCVALQLRHGDKANHHDDYHQDVGSRWMGSKQADHLPVS